MLPHHLEHPFKVIHYFLSVLESSQWPKTGLLYGATTHFGNMAECLRSQGPDGIYGQYCLVELVYNFTWTSHPPSMAWPDESESAWDTIKTVNN